MEPNREELDILSINKNVLSFDTMLTPTLSRLIIVSFTSLLTPTLSCLVQNPLFVHKSTREQQTMAITKNLGPKLEEHQHQHNSPVPVIQHRLSSSANDYLAQNKQDEPNSSSSNIRSSNKGNQSSYFTVSNDVPPPVTVETVIDTGNKDESVEEIKVKEEHKGEQSV